MRWIKQKDKNKKTEVEGDVNKNRQVNDAV